MPGWRLPISCLFSMIERRYWPVSVSVSEQGGDQDLTTEQDLECLCPGGVGGGGGVSPENIVSVSLFISPHLCHLTCHLGMLSSDHCQPLVLSVSISLQSGLVDTRSWIKNAVIMSRPSSFING